jgi:PAS domain S-box-containing protein
MNQPNSKFEILVSPWRLFVRVLLAVLLVSLILNLFLSRLFRLEEMLASSVFTWEFLDSTALSLLLAPFLWWWIMRPLGSTAMSERMHAANILSTSADAIITIDGRGRIISFNPAAQRLFGYAKDEAIDQNVKMLMPPSDRDQYAEDLFRHFDNAEKEIIGLRRELVALRKDGANVPIYLSLSKAHEGRRTIFTGIVHDLTERKRADRERQALFEIIQGVTASADLETLLRLIHQTIQKVLHAENCFVALVDKDNVTLGMEFFVDQHDSIPAPQEMGKGCTAYVFRTGKPLLLNQELFNQLLAAGEVEQVGKFSPSWLGVPLNTPSKTIGVLVVQHYEDDKAYSKRDVEFLSSVGGQLAMAIERKRAEVTLRESEESYRDLVENSRELITTHDLDGWILSANRAAAEVLGYDRKDYVGKTSVRELLVPGVRDEFDEYLARIRKDGVADGLMLVQTRTGERRVWEYYSTVRTEGVHTPIVRSVARDITERKQAEAELVRLAAAVEQTADSIVITDIEGNIQYVNPAFERITGYSKQETLGQNSRILKSGKTDKLVYRDLWETISRGEIWVGQLANRRKDGTLFEEHVTISPVRDNSGRIVNYIAVKQDTTLQTQLETQLRQSQRLEAVGQLAGGVAHDFNNLLVAINGYSELAMKRLDDASTLKSYLEEIKKAGDRAANLTRQLLAFSRKQILEPKVLVLNDLVGDMCKMLGRMIGEDIELSTSLTSDLGTVKADPGQIEQIIVNLAVNARDAMQSGGKLMIETANVFLDDEYARKHQPTKPGQYVMLAVGDTGTGMDAETQARIFEPFFTTKEQGKGTGLGLSTVYGIVKQSGGFIWVYSEPGHGTTFKMYLPRVDAEKTTRVKSADEAVEYGSETILLVEDEEVVRKLAREVLESAGYEVMVAGEGEEATRLCIEHPQEIHLLLSDVVMPGASGTEVAARLSSLHPEMKVLFMSGYTDEAIVRHGVLDCRVKFLQKPFSPVSLCRKVRDVLDSH